MKEYVKCVYVRGDRGDYFTIGKVYKVDNEGIIDDGDFQWEDFLKRNGNTQEKLNAFFSTTSCMAEFEIVATPKKTLLQYFMEDLNGVKIGDKVNIPIWGSLNPYTYDGVVLKSENGGTVDMSSQHNTGELFTSDIKIVKKSSVLEVNLQEIADKFDVSIKDLKIVD